MLNTTDHLGSFSSYYTLSSNRDISKYRHIGEYIRKVNSQVDFDPVAIIEVLNQYYMLGDRTILQNIYRTPWRAEYSEMRKDWDFFDLPKHGSVLKTEVETAAILFDLLCEEIEMYVSNSTRIGILLSGGMDSRIVAGVLQYVLKRKSDRFVQVVAYTWGDEGSRDVVYAERIAKLFGWTWKHFVVCASDLWENIRLAGERGCEYTGFHLHAIPRISEIVDVDLVLAGSYGDSVGQAEYSGSNLAKVRSIGEKFSNPAYLIKSAIFNRYKDFWKQDINRYRAIFPRERDYECNEIDRQLHYMRRMLNPCMELINNKVPLYQVFTAPSVFGFMWSLDIKLRNDSVYFQLLTKLDPELSQIPWARTGTRFGSINEVPDKYRKEHHSYPRYVAVDLIEKIENRLLGESRLSKTILNESAVVKLVSLIRDRMSYNFDFMEKLLWLTSFSFFVDLYEIEDINEEGRTLTDLINAHLALPLNYAFLTQMRKLKSIVF